MTITLNFQTIALGIGWIAALVVGGFFLWLFIEWLIESWRAIVEATVEFLGEVVAGIWWAKPAYGCIWIVQAAIHGLCFGYAPQWYTSECRQASIGLWIVLGLGVLLSLIIIPCGMDEAKKEKAKRERGEKS